MTPLKLKIPKGCGKFSMTSRRRDYYIERYSFAIPSEQALTEIAKYSPIIEIGAGTGYWAKLLEERGTDIVAFDTYQETYCFYENPKGNTFKPRHFNIQLGSYEQLCKYPNRTLFLCWPPMNDLAFFCINFLHAKYFIYIGEDMYGCNANNRFFRYRNRHFKQIKGLAIPKWWGLHDFLEIYERRLP